MPESRALERFWRVTRRDLLKIQVLQEIRPHRARTRKILNLQPAILGGKPS